jgi:hypothetical protein
MPAWVYSLSLSQGKVYNLKLQNNLSNSSLSKIQFLFRQLMILKMSHEEAAEHFLNVELFSLSFFQVINTWHLGNAVLNLQSTQQFWTKLTVVQGASHIYKFIEQAFIVCWYIFRKGDYCLTHQKWNDIQIKIFERRIIIFLIPYSAFLTASHTLHNNEQEYWQKLSCFSEEENAKRLLITSLVSQGLDGKPKESNPGCLECTENLLEYYRSWRTKLEWPIEELTLCELGDYGFKSSY